jgi:short-subunit dehydrogenase
MKRAVIIGASTGIGRQLARILHAEGWTLGLIARRVELLEQLQTELELEGEARIFVRRMDVAHVDETIEVFEELIQHLGGMDLAVINAGVGFHNARLKWEHERNTIAVNVTGFAAAAGVAYRFFHEAKRGHLVGMSSVACHRGGRQAPAYAASKAFVTNYLEGLRMRASRARPGITVTDIRPGFVDTPMTRGQKGMFWVAPVEKASQQIYRAIVRRRNVVYVTKRWWFMAALLKRLPDFVYAKI